jgi:hypothetical protein
MRLRQPRRFQSEKRRRGAVHCDGIVPGNSLEICSCPKSDLRSANDLGNRWRKYL